MNGEAVETGDRDDDCFPPSRLPRKNHFLHGDFVEYFDDGPLARFDEIPVGTPGIVLSSNDAVAVDVAWATREGGVVFEAVYDQDRLGRLTSSEFYRRLDEVKAGERPPGPAQMAGAGFHLQDYPDAVVGHSGRVHVIGDGRSDMATPPRVRLVPASVRLLDALTEDRAVFAELLGSPVPDGWPEFPEAIGFTLEHLRTATDADRVWSMHLFLDHETGRLLGSGGFAAPPTGRSVEIGYEIAPEFRGRGYGTAAARALVELAVASGEVEHVLAHTLPHPNASTGVLLSLGFEHVADREDEEVGAVWEWRWTAAAIG